MQQSIQIYIRNSGGEDMLNIYIPSNLRESFLNGIRNGLIGGIDVPINFEMSVSPERSTDFDEPIHVARDIKCINIHYVE